ncbi:phospholipid/cholesterol/gamma-HCH transport system substrate-binding protein [Actinomadura pelletieri DSM 43383]|uniref:Phospholipid/cholesterol/gamma-HCH transport system substrate-binding protein n=1 Tax=Actinomadura pelletieri DSM 43383 TaxID=1120940 RepID=A0A495QRE7_9ACTN|nr:MCE family protein [Actinomadura pelletieri]RKS76070.1 phospholipid/cholesterol/gamma-HCH transport system substrate-binding protein [Actinomadura pelletieri DSM 43383]
MTTTRRPARLARSVGAATIALTLAGCSFDGVASLPLPGGPDLGADPTTVKIEFADVLDLVPQSAVKVNDVSVGKVDEIELAGGASGGRGGWHAVVTVKIRKDVALPDNAVAAIGQTSLLGEKFVRIDPPKNEAPAGKLASGDLIPLDRTTRGTEVEEVLSAMSLLLNGGGLEQVSTISRELQAAMRGRESTIRSVLHRVDTFVGTLDRNRAAIVRALDSIDRLSGRLATERKTIRNTIDETGPAIAVLDRNRADLTRMLVALNRLGRTTTNVIDQSKADMLANLRDLDTILRNLNRAGSDLPKALESAITFPFPATFENTIAGDYGNVRLTLDLDFEAIARNLLGGTDVEGLLGSGGQRRDMLQGPNGNDGPLGVLPEMPGDGDPGALPDLPDLLAPTEPPPSRPERPGQPPRPGGGDLWTLLMGGMS